MAKLEDELAIKQHRDVLWLVTGAHKYYKKVEPHITLIPPFTVQPGHEKDVQDIVSQLDVRGKKVKVTGINLYEDIEQPYVVMLSVNVDLEDEREELMEKLPQYANGKIIEPVSPHITLFKTQGWWSDIDVNTRDILKHELDNRRPSNTTEITNVSIDFN
jgi:2'-5' RNA ligase